MDTFVRWGPPAPGADDGTRAQTAAVHRRVQGRGGQAARGERQGPAAGGGRARRPRQPAPDVVSLPWLDGHLRKVGSTSTGSGRWRRSASGGGSPPSTRPRRSSGSRRAPRPCSRWRPSSASTPTSSGRGATSVWRPAPPRPWPDRRPKQRSGRGGSARTSGWSRRTRSSSGPPLFSPGRRSRHGVPLRRRRARDLAGAEAVPARGRRGERLLRLAAPRARPPRGRGCRPRRTDRRDLRGEPADLRQPPHPRRAARGRRPDRPRAGGAAHAPRGPDGRAALPAARRLGVPRATNSRHDHPVAPNLLGRNFVAGRPDTVWLADISYIPTGEGWLYLAAIKDMATREIVGWGMADHLRAELCEQALLVAIRRRQPDVG